MTEPPVIRVASDPAWPLIIVISGGQTGADQAVLRAARDCGYRTGGMAPRGYRTDEGAALWLKEYDLTEGPHTSYAPRTEWNVRNSTGTIWFGDAGSPGGRLTLDTCARLHRPYVTVEPMGGSDRTNPLDFSAAITVQIRAWIIKHQITTLNGAGNRERTNPGIGARVEAIMREVLRRYTPLFGGSNHATTTQL